MQLLAPRVTCNMVVTGESDVIVISLHSENTYKAEILTASSSILGATAVQDVSLNVNGLFCACCLLAAVVTTTTHGTVYCLLKVCE